MENIQPCLTNIINSRIEIDNWAPRVWSIYLQLHLLKKKLKLGVSTSMSKYPTSKPKDFMSGMDSRRPGTSFYPGRLLIWCGPSSDRQIQYTPRLLQEDRAPRCMGIRKSPARAKVENVRHVRNQQKCLCQCALLDWYNKRIKIIHPKMSAV